VSWVLFDAVREQFNGGLPKIQRTVAALPLCRDASSASAKTSSMFGNFATTGIRGMFWLLFLGLSSMQSHLAVGSKKRCALSGNTVGNLILPKKSWLETIVVFSAISQEFVLRQAATHK
jgi:hypothetical protein